MALVTSLTELGCALLGAGIKPNGSISGPDLDRIESTHHLTRPQPARRPFLPPLDFISSCRLHPLILTLRLDFTSSLLLSTMYNSLKYNLCIHTCNQTLVGFLFHSSDELISILYTLIPEYTLYNPEPKQIHPCSPTLRWPIPVTVP